MSRDVSRWQGVCLTVCLCVKVGYLFLKKRPTFSGNPLFL